jgi:hypothetical protein
MGLSYHDEKSMVETAASWRFASYNRNPGPEIGVQQPENDDIEIVDR